jgi:SAM-dependent methyltransferase
MQGQWFESWFDSPWYPILYSHRDHAEAEAFIEKLLEALAPAPGSQFLDLACGRGRHSRFIHARGFDVMGIDLSAASIADAKKWEAPGLRFGVHDMRKPFPQKVALDTRLADGSRVYKALGFDYILNLFTSFGYFAERSENALVLQNVAKALGEEGTFVMDFFNLKKVLKEMVPHQELEKGGVHFSIRKRYEAGVILKEIDLMDQGESYHFEERVQGLDLPVFEEMFRAAGLEIYRIWGDYQGGAFDPDHSPRLILFARHQPQPPAA